MLNGSSLGAIKDCMGLDEGHHDVFVGIEHRLRGDRLAETLNKESKRYKITADDARTAKDSEVVGMEISEGVFVDANHLTSAAPVDGVEFDGLQVNEGRIAEAWVKCHQRIHVFAVYSWHSEGWTTRSEELVAAVLRRVADTKTIWIIACDANLKPCDFQFCDLCVKALASGVSFYGAKSADEKNMLTMSWVAKLWVIPLATKLTKQKGEECDDIRGVKRLPTEDKRAHRLRKHEFGGIGLCRIRFAWLKAAMQRVTKNSGKQS